MGGVIRLCILAPSIFETLACEKPVTVHVWELDSSLISPLFLSLDEPERLSVVALGFVVETAEHQPVSTLEAIIGPERLAMIHFWRPKDHSRP